MKVKELRDSSIEELQKIIANLRSEKWKMRMQGQTGQAARYDQFSKMRKDIARAYTVMREKSMQQESKSS
ncbi:MAG: 50S ribosomal protein L29 [Candidatus Oxydemutatoraceae bacterium WSBS_2016_MAG_OTU14]